MIEEQARVVEVEGDSVWVETQRKTVCGNCSASKGCGTGTLSKMFRIRSPRLRVVGKPGVRTGDEVVIGIDEHAMVRGAMAVYAFPLLFMLGFAWLGREAGAHLGFVPVDGMSILGGAIGLGLGFLWLSGHTARVNIDGRYQPVILRVMNDHDAARCDISGS